MDIITLKIGVYFDFYIPRACTFGVLIPPWILNLSPQAVPSL